MAEKLIPKDHGFGTRRVPLESGYFETYNRDNVTLIDTLVDEPIECITLQGIKTVESTAIGRRKRRSSTRFIPIW